METIGAVEAKTHLSSLLEWMTRGETFTITRHGKPMAQLGPVHSTDRARRQAAIERLKTFGIGRRLYMDWHELLDTGRRY